jgi:hypothetical protein
MLPVMPRPWGLTAAGGAGLALGRAVRADAFVRDPEADRDVPARRDPSPARVGPPAMDGQHTPTARGGGARR